MTRLIDADALTISVLKKAMDDAFLNGNADMHRLLIQVIAHQPTVDAEPVRHGKWIPCAKSGLILSEQMRREGIRWYGFKCSACNYVRKGNALREANYCPNCGARMDEND